MRVAALYDIHGNLPALEAVLHEVRQAGIDRIVVGGDVLPGPMPRETLACLRALEIPAQFIKGNGDREVLGVLTGTDTGAVPETFREVMRWNALELQPDEVRFVDAWPATLRLTWPELGEVLF